jgi:hypothetical protein
MEKQVWKIDVPGYMKVVYTHVHRYDGSAPGRKNDGSEDACYKEDIFSFKQKCRDHEIINDVIICRDKNQIAELDRHCFRNTYRIGPENNHPKAVNGDPEQHMKEK